MSAGDDERSKPRVRDRPAAPFQPLREAPGELVPAAASAVEPPEAGPEGTQDFAVKVFFDAPELVGTRWWNDSLQAYAAGALDRRRFLGKAGLLLGGGAVATVVGLQTCDDGGDKEIDLDALVLQRRDGWDVGARQATLLVNSRVPLDADGRTDWSAHLTTLGQQLAPVDARLAPMAVGTLFQSLPSSASDNLRRAVQPVWNDEMKRTHERAGGLAALAAVPGAPPDVALVLDLPGPQAVAAAAALAERFVPVFMFDNWPHPDGVVPSHQTLGAALYYRPVFTAANGVRPGGAAPVFVLDSSRLTPYQDDPKLFDNRYVVNLPSADQLRALGIRRLLYVRPGAGDLQELDDLNSDFVALDRAGVEVRAVSLEDFQQATVAEGRTSQSHHYFGGHPHHQLFFWSHYGWAGPPQVTPRMPRPPTALPPQPSYRPALRPTIFSSRAVGGLGGVGKQKPSGFGRVSVRSSDGSYRGGSSRRSGSFGRSRSSGWS